MILSCKVLWNFNWKVFCVRKNAPELDTQQFEVRRPRIDRLGNAWTKTTRVRKQDRICKMMSRNAASVKC